MSSSRRRFLQAAAAGAASLLPSSPFEEKVQAQGGTAPEAAGYVLVTSANGVEAAKTNALSQCRAKSRSCNVIATVCANGSNQQGAAR